MQRGSVCAASGCLPAVRARCPAVCGAHAPPCGNSQKQASQLHVLGPRVGVWSIGGPSAAPQLPAGLPSGYRLSGGASCPLARPANASLLSYPSSVLYLFPLPALLWLGLGTPGKGCQGKGCQGKGCWLPAWDRPCCRGGWKQMCLTKMQLFLSLYFFF